MNTVETEDLVVNTLQKALINDGLLNGKSKSTWVGTMTELHSAMMRVAGRKNSRQLPQSASSLRVVLNRVINRVRCRGITVNFSRSTDYNRTRLVTFVG